MSSLIVSAHLAFAVTIVVISVGVFSASDEYSDAGGVSGVADTAAHTYTNFGDNGELSTTIELAGVSGGVGAAIVTVLGGGSGGSDLLYYNI